MAITTKNRKQLKAYFVKNGIPTEGNFADLIDAPLNQAEDGVFRLPGEPLSVVAAQGEQKRALRFYSTYPAANPDWQISLNPGQNPADPATMRPGFGVTDGTGNTRLFIDPATGHLGVGTNTPADRLTVHGGDLRIEGDNYHRLKILAVNAGIELVARNPGGTPHIDFTQGELDSIDYGIRLITTENRVLHVQCGSGNPALLRVYGDLVVDGQQNKLDVAEQGAAVVRAADLLLGHSARRGSPGRALVDESKEALVLNYAGDWSRVDVRSPLAIGGNLTVYVPGVGGWDRLVVTASDAWNNGNAHVTIGAGGAAGLMINNPHVSWYAGERRASIRYGMSLPNKVWWDVGLREDDTFTFAASNGGTPLVLRGDGDVLVTRNLGVGTSTPGGPLEVRVPGVGGWDRLVVTASDAWNSGNMHVTIGAGGAAGLMINNPHVSWYAFEKRASIRYGLSLPNKVWWDVGLREDDTFTFAASNGGTPLVLRGDGDVLVTRNLGVGTSTPGGPLEVRVPGVGGWDRLVVTASDAWNDGNAHVTIGAGGAAGLMISNPHVSWFAGEKRASIRYGLSLPNKVWWDVGLREDDTFTFAASNGGTPLVLRGDGDVLVTRNLTVGGALNKLDVAEQGAAIVRASDLLLGHSTRRGSPGRALVDESKDALVVNYAGDWSRVDVHSPLNVAGGLNVAGIVNTSGLVFQNPVDHLNYDGALYRNKDGQVYLTVDDHFYIRGSNSPNWGAHFDTNGNLELRGSIRVAGQASLGTAQTTGDLNQPVPGGFHEFPNPAARVPDNSHDWVHMISARHSNPANNHQFQIASTYAENDRMFFRKIARGDLTPGASTWNEVATVTNGSLKIGDWSLTSEGNHLVIRRGQAVVARFSIDHDRFHVYRNLNYAAPYFYYNSFGISGST